MERVAYDEFGLFAANASEFGLPYDGPPTVRREFVAVDDERRLSALVWGSDAPELVFLHGGAQNAHTWDTVAMALGRPLVCIDLPGHGHSDGGRHGQLDLADNAADVAVAIRALAPDAKAVVGMSLGGMTTIALARHAPDLVRAMVLVDITPGVTAEKAKAITDFVNGPASFPSFEELLARTMEHNPTRSEASLRRGILHNAEQREDGSWVWRYARHRQLGPDAEQAPRPETDRSELWDVIAGLTVPLLLVRGMRPQSVVDDGDEAELQRRLPSAQVVHVEEAGHSVQGDTPLELAQIIADFVP
ncbi:MAG TPA: alpha/beta hydrolase [Ilumatobacteraceae bacterium]|nr:alpha/beta hydrolase [Ilumatobacteraceae bacterium]